MLRSLCLYCFHFRIARAQVNRFECKLKLIQYGLLVEAAELDDIHPEVKKVEGDEEAEISGSTDMEAFYAKREKFVAKAIRRLLRSAGLNEGQVMSVAEERRKIVKEFLGALQIPRKCNRCQAQVFPLGKLDLLVFVNFSQNFTRIPKRWVLENLRTTAWPKSAKSECSMRLATTQHGCIAEEAQRCVENKEAWTRCDGAQ